MIFSTYKSPLNITTSPYRSFIPLLSHYENCEPLLLQLVQFNDLEFVKVLLERGASIKFNMIGNAFPNILTKASTIEMIDLLLSYGAQVRLLKVEKEIV